MIPNLRKILIAVLFIVAGVLLLWLVVEPLAENKALKKMRSALPGYYALHVNTFDLCLLPLGFTATGIELKVDQSQLQKVDAPPSYYEGSIDTLGLSGLRLFPLVFGDRLSMGRVQVVNPDVTWHIIDSGAGQDSFPKSSKPAFRQIKVGKIQITNGRISTNTIGNGPAGDLQVTAIETELSDLVYTLPDNGFSYGELIAAATLKSYRTPDSLYDIAVERIVLHSRDAAIRVDSIAVKPLFSEREFSEVISYRQDRLDVTIPQVSFSGVDFQKLFAGEAIRMRRIEIERPGIYIFKDMRVPASPDPVKLPSGQLQELDMGLSIDLVMIDQGEIVYAELKEEEIGPGVLTFKELAADFENISTLNQKAGRISASADLMGGTTIDAEFTYPAGFATDTFHVSASIGSVPLSKFNPVTTGTAFLEIEEGLLNRLDFSFSANSKQAVGQMEMYYEQLDFKILTKKGGENQLVGALAELAVVKENPKNDDFRVGEIRFEREEERSIFNYWWKSLLSGFKSSITPGD